MISAENASRAKGLQLAEKLQQELLRALDEQVKVILFGSQARGDAVEDSDVVNRSYYAMFYGVLELLTTIGSSARRPRASMQSFVALQPTTEKECLGSLKSLDFFK